MEGKVIKCQAAILCKLNEPLILDEIEVSPPQAGEVRIKIHATSVCHTDLTATTGQFPGTHLPCILGHEAAGIVESVGTGVTTVKPGDKVIPLYMPQCLECEYCISGKSNSCSKLRQTQSLGLMPDGTTRFTWKGQPLHHFMGTSTFSEYTVLPEVAIAKINDKAPMEKVGLLGCGVPTGYGAAVNTAKVEAGSVCAVWGLGCIGLAAVMGCKAAGAKRIFAIDINSAKFDKAKILGATDCLNPNDFEKPIQQVVKDMTNDMGVDYAIECVGAVVTSLACIEATCNGWGVAVVMGVPFSKDKIPLDAWHLILGKTIKGSGFGGYGGRTQLPSLVDEYLAGKFQLDEFITQELTLDDINTAFDLLKEGKSIRSMLKC